MKLKAKYLAVVWHPYTGTNHWETFDKKKKAERYMKNHRLPNGQLFSSFRQINTTLRQGQEWAERGMRAALLKCLRWHETYYADLRQKTVANEQFSKSTEQ